MQSPEDFIARQRATGQHEDYIREQLKQAGYSDAQITQSLQRGYATPYQQEPFPPNTKSSVGPTSAVNKVFGLLTLIHVVGLALLYLAVELGSEGAGWFFIALMFSFAAIIPFWLVTFLVVKLVQRSANKGIEQTVRTGGQDQIHRKHKAKLARNMSVIVFVLCSIIVAFILLNFTQTTNTSSSLVSERASVSSQAEPGLAITLNIIFTILIFTAIPVMSITALVLLWKESASFSKKRVLIYRIMASSFIWMTVLVGPFLFFYLEPAYNEALISRTKERGYNSYIPQSTETYGVIDGSLEEKVPREAQFNLRHRDNLEETRLTLKPKDASTFSKSCIDESSENQCSLVTTSETGRDIYLYPEQDGAVIYTMLIDDNTVAVIRVLPERFNSYTVSQLDYTDTELEEIADSLKPVDDEEFSDFFTVVIEPEKVQLDYYFEPETLSARPTADDGLFSVKDVEVRNNYLSAQYRRNAPAELQTEPIRTVYQRMSVRNIRYAEAYDVCEIARKQILPCAPVSKLEDGTQIYETVGTTNYQGEFISYPIYKIVVDENHIVLFVYRGYDIDTQYDRPQQDFFDDFVSSLVKKDISQLD